jgi:hypothetical protein
METKRNFSFYLTESEKELVTMFIKQKRIEKEAREAGFILPDDKPEVNMPVSRKNEILFSLYCMDHDIRNKVHTVKNAVSDKMSKDETYLGTDDARLMELYDELAKVFGSFDIKYDCLQDWYHRENDKEEPEEEPKPKKDKNLNPFLGKKNLKKHKESEQS